MQHAFKRVDVYEEVDEGLETKGPFGRTKHMGRVENKGRHHKQNTCEEAETFTETETEYIERKHDFLVKAK